MLSERPSHIPRTRPRGAPGKGITYERAFGRYAAGLFNHRRLFADQWITYYDDHGAGYANIDGFVIADSAVILWECKLTQQVEAFHQMEQKYVPLLRHLYGMPIVTLQVCRNLVERISAKAETTIEDQYYDPRPGVRLTQHWMK